MHAQTLDRDQYGGFWRRMAAFWVDVLVLLPLFIIHIVLHPEPPEDVYPTVVSVFPFLLPYHLFVSDVTIVDNVIWAAFLDMALFILTSIYPIVFFLSSWRATPGYRAMGIYLADESGKDVGAWQVVTRFWGSLASFLAFGLGYLMIAFTAKRQALHDFMARTVVMRGIK